MLHNSDNVPMFSSQASAAALYHHPDQDYVNPGGWHFTTLMRATFLCPSGVRLLAFKGKRCNARSLIGSGTRLLQFHLNEVISG